MPQILWGKNLNGEIVFRAMRPGYDALTEPLGSVGCAFDSRIDVQGIAWKAGSCVADQAVGYPSSPRYTPLLRFFEIDGNNLFEGELYGTTNAAGVITNRTSPWVGVCFPSYFVITKQNNPFYGFTPQVGNGSFAYVLFRGLI